jgi:hypothetical protein
VMIDWRTETSASSRKSKDSVTKAVGAQLKMRREDLVAATNATPHAVSAPLAPWRQTVAWPHWGGLRGARGGGGGLS